MFKIIRNIIKSFVAVVLTLAVLYFSIAIVHGNFYRIDKDTYRSGQLFSFNMPHFIKKHKIKTILNLRGANLEKDWYKNEIKISKKYDIEHINYPMSSGSYLTPTQTSEIVEILKNVKKPLLIHCEGGADRTSLVAALYNYAILNKSEDESKKEFQWFYGHLPIIRPKVVAMDKSFEDYVIFVENN